MVVVLVVLVVVTVVTERNRSKLQSPIRAIIVSATHQHHHDGHNHDLDHDPISVLLALMLYFAPAPSLQQGPIKKDNTLPDLGSALRHIETLVGRQRSEALIEIVEQNFLETNYRNHCSNQHYHMETVWSGTKESPVADGQAL